MNGLYTIILLIRLKFGSINKHLLLICSRKRGIILYLSSFKTNILQIADNDIF